MCMGIRLWYRRPMSSKHWEWHKAGRGAQLNSEVGEGHGKGKKSSIHGSPSVVFNTGQLSHTRREISRETSRGSKPLVSDLSVPLKDSTMVVYMRALSTTWVWSSAIFSAPSFGQAISRILDPLSDAPFPIVLCRKIHTNTVKLFHGS